MFWRNPKFQVGVGGVDYNEGKCLMFHPLFPGEVLSKINFDISLAFKGQESNIHPSEFYLGFFVVKASDHGMRRSYQLLTEYEYSSDAVSASSSTADVANNQFDKFVRELLIQRGYEHDETYAEPISDHRGSDDHDMQSMWDPNWNENTVTTIWKKSGWLEKEWQGSTQIGDEGSAAFGPRVFIDVKTSKERRIYEPSFLIGGVFRPKPRIETHWGFERFNHIQPDSGAADAASRQQMWNPEVVENMLNDQAYEQLQHTDSTTAADRARQLAKMLTGDNFIEDGAFSDAADTSSYDKGFAYLRGNASIRTPINSPLIRLGGGIY
jgi:hypothetical protein